MNGLKLSLGLLCFVSVAVLLARGEEEAAEEVEGSTFATILSSDNFNELVPGNKWLIMFYAPWCGHCKKLKPAWSRLARVVLDSPDEYQANIGQIDCTVNTAICNDQGVRGYPTIKYISPNHNLVYDGRRLEPDFMEYIKKLDAPPVVEIAADQLEAVDPTYFVFVGNNKESSLYKTYVQSAYAHIMVSSFYHVLAGYPESLTPPDGAFGVAVVSETGAEFYKGEADVDSLNQWVRAKFLGKLPLLTGALAKYVSTTTPLDYLGMALTYDLANQTGFIDSVRQYVLEGKPSGSVEQFVRSDTYQIGGFITSHLRLRRKNLPAFAVVSLKNMDFYLYDGAMSASYIDHDALTDFLERVERGEVEVAGGAGFFGKTKRMLNRYSDDILYAFYTMYTSYPNLFLFMFALTTFGLGRHFYLRMIAEAPPIYDKDGNVLVPASSDARRAAAEFPGMGGDTPANKKDD